MYGQFFDRLEQGIGIKAEFLQRFLQGLELSDLRVMFFLQRFSGLCPACFKTFVVGGLAGFGSRFFARCFYQRSDGFARKIGRCWRTRCRG